MKTLKKISALILALAMCFALAMPASAADITVGSAVKGRTYSIYQIFTLETHEGDNYSYKIVTGWEAFAEAQGMELDDNGFLSGDYSQYENSQEFTQAALAYAEANDIEATDTVEADDSSAVFEDVALGYYLVSSTGGAYVSVNSVEADVTIQEKNGTPSVEKTVVEKENYGDTNTVSVGDVVTFKAVVTVKDGAIGYVLHDTMDSGLSYLGITEVTASDGSTVAYTEKSTPDDGDTFTVTFDDTYLAGLDDGTQITVVYTAEVTKDAVSEDNCTSGNEIELDYGDGNTTTSSSTETKTYEIGADGTLKKVNTTGGSLAGVGFTLTNSAGKYVTIDDDNILNGWSATESKLYTDEDGKLNVKGLDADTYTLTETDPLPGYNNLINPITIVIAEDGTVTYIQDGESLTSIEIENNSGSVLPSTGGIGTTIFYVVGGVLVVAAGVLLVTKKRMGE